MRHRRAAWTLALFLSWAAGAGAQAPVGRDSTPRRGLPSDVAAQAASAYNATAAIHANARVEIEAGREIPGDVAVLDGPLIIAGHVTGRVTAINADVLLRRGARIDGDLLVVGGDVEGRESADVRGATRIFRQSLRYRLSGDTLVPVEDSALTERESWWRRLERQHAADGNWSRLHFATAGAYNRVEGLPVNLGPQLNRTYDWGSLRLDAYGIVRTGSSFASTDNDVGHNVRGEVRIGAWSGVALGARVYNVIDAVESWTLADMEVGLASFLAHRDYRDYYQRHGASGSLSVFAFRDASLTASFGMERWGSRLAHDPFTLFRNESAWRANPAVDDGLMHLTTGTLTVDTRSNDANPWSGWYIVADFERGVGTLARSTIVATPGGGVALARGASAGVDYARGFVDLRRYNRVSPSTQLNFRLVGGGWLNGDPLPLERRLSVDGPGVLPGFGFRVARSDADVGRCAEGAALPGDPALCDRIALAQTEYRRDLHLDLGRVLGWWTDTGEEQPGEPRARRHFQRDGAWVVFGDAGRGWLVTSGVPSSPLTFRRGELPPLSSVRADIGGGIDLGGLGVYVARALSRGDEPVRVFVRVKHRF